MLAAGRRPGAPEQTAMDTAALIVADPAGR